MASEQRYPKRLIEVDLPIKEISAHSRREKSIRHGHISTLHIWWARRPLAACRAVTCAALWPDPADDLCPQPFRDAVAEILCEFAEMARTDAEVMALVQPHWTRWSRLGRGAWQPDNPACWWDMRYALLDFIADFSNWDSSTVPSFLEDARAWTQPAHQALGGDAGTRPMVVDPFAGGGSIPLEALRVGAEAFASDLNPVPVLLNKVILEYIPKYRQCLADEVREWGNWILREAQRELAEVYPKDPDGETPLAYLWARTIQCEGPGCGTEVPLIRSLWLSKKASHSVALQLVPRRATKHVDLRIITKKHDQWMDQNNPELRIRAPAFEGTIKGVAVTCPCCGFTTKKDRVRAQLVTQSGGANSARLLCVVTSSPEGKGRVYRLPTDSDLESLRASRIRSEELSKSTHADYLPDEPIPHERVWKNNPIRVHLYGMGQWCDIYTDRQALALATLARLVRDLGEMTIGAENPGLAEAVGASLALAVGRQADYTSSLCSWVPSGEFICHTFGRQAIPMVWDFVEVAPLAGATGSFAGAIEWIARVLDREALSKGAIGHVGLAAAARHPLPDDSCEAVITDPPYYDAVPYSTLSNYFYVWLKRAVPAGLACLFSETLAPNREECVVDEAKGKTQAVYEAGMAAAMLEARRALMPRGILVIVFAHKSTAGWEALLGALVDSGWVVTGSWPIDTERPGRLRANNSAALASSVHLICRPRENADGSLRTDSVGDWRGVLAELPDRIHQWMPRLSKDGVVGADAIFSCLGPALEIFSRHSYVEKATGARVYLKEYLEHVWAAVAREALTMIFEDADATGLEEDARLTAMWLWTLSTSLNGADSKSEPSDQDPREDEVPKVKSSGGFSLEYDAARKIAQGLGAHLENLASLVEIKGDQARLLPVAQRTKYLFGKDVRQQAPAPRRGKPKQMTLFAELEVAEQEAGWGETGIPSAGETTLDRVHQAMILFAAGRAEALKRFLVEEGVGRDAKMWKLAQSLSALYPAGTDEKRWVDGVLARKKSLGFG